MSAFSNPFAQVGDYQGQRSIDDELVTTSYLTGLPDPRLIENQHVGLIFRTLLKRDTRTKQRALGEFEQWIDGLSSESDVEDSVHLAYVQMYSKLSIDAAPLIRSQSHVILAKLYTLLGKRSSKYFKYSVGPWLAATNDPDPRGAVAAKDALGRVFPGDKQTVLMEKMKEHILEFVYDCCSNASAQTLSDERYVSKEDASQKYTRLVKCCIDILARVPNMFDLNTEEVESLVSSGRLWKFYSSSDPSLARSTLQLTMAHVADLEPYSETVWHELLRAGRRNSGGSGVAIEVVQLMNIFTKRYPAITWPEDAAARKDAMVSLAQFVAADPPHPSRFWPLLYNLVLMVPDSPSRDLTPLYKPLEKTVMKIKHDTELERSAWGCFVSLAGKMGPEYVHRAFKAAEQRCKQKTAVAIDILATFLARLANTEGVQSIVKSQLEDTKVPFTYCRVIAQTQLFRSDIESIIIPRIECDQLVLLVEADPDLSLPEVKDVASSPLWVAIAAKSNTVDAQPIVEAAALNAGPEFVLAMLEQASALADRGVRISLDKLIPQEINEAALPILKAAVSAHGTLLAPETSIRSFKMLVQRAMNDEGAAKDMFRVIRENQDFINSVIASDSETRHDLETLKAEDKLGVLRRLPAMKTQSRGEDHASSSATTSIQHLRALDLSSLDLSVPLQIVSDLRATVPLSGKPLAQALVECENLLTSITPALENSHIGTDEIVKLFVLYSFAQDWIAVALKGKSSTITSFLHSIDDFLEGTPPIKEVWQQLWELSHVENYALAYHAAKGLSLPLWAEQFSVACYSKKYFVEASLQGALIALHHAAIGNQEYENVQRSLVRRALTHNLDKREWMLIDRTFIPQAATFRLNDTELKDAELTCMIFETIPNVEQRMMLAFEPKSATVQLSALKELGGETPLMSVLRAAANLPIERNNFDKEKGFVMLGIVSKIVEANPPSTIEDWQVVQALLSRRDSQSLPWMALAVARSVERVELGLNLEHAQQGPVTRAEIVSWLIYLNYLSPASHTVASHELHLRILEFVARGLRQNGELVGHENLHEPEFLPSDEFHDDACDGNLLYKMCVHHGNDVREWYRNLRDKQTQKYVDSALATYIVPALISSIKDEIESNPPSSEAEVSVNRKQREIRAAREVEDEFTVEIVISLPEQYPGKPAMIEIRNLAGVSEAKKRGWLLEARQNVQNEGVLKALSGILTRLNNFLEGVEPCAICYATVNDANKLPNRECSQCHNIYHSECLYKWFSTNNDKLCPMCRSPM